MHHKSRISGSPAGRVGEVSQAGGYVSDGGKQEASGEQPASGDLPAGWHGLPHRVVGWMIGLVAARRLVVG
jgi:hypothetical protein